MKPPHRNPNVRGNERPFARRGVAALVFAAALLVVGTLVLWVFQATATGARGALGNLAANGAFYAAESGVEFSLFELKNNADLDGDGGVGTISNDGNDADDPSIGTGSFHVRYAADKVTSTGDWQQCTRVVEATMQ